MAARVLLIHPDIRFAATLKQALERIQSFEVHPFTSLDAAADFLRDYPHDVALVDLTLPGIDAAVLVTRLRAAQPGLPIIATPEQTDASIERLELEGSIAMPFTARDIIPLLKRAVEDAARVRRSIAPTMPLQKPAEAGDTTLQQPARFSPLEDVLRTIGDKADLFESQVEHEDTQSFDVVDDTPLDEPMGVDDFGWLQSLVKRENDAVFDKIAREEPPPPDIEDGTIGELMTAIDDGRFRDVLAILRGEDVPLAQETSTDEPPSARYEFEFPDEDVVDEGLSTARIVLETALDDTTPLELLSLENLIDRLQRKLPVQQPYVQPLPSWSEESSSIHEPGFLPELNESDDIAYQTTIPSKVERPPTLPEDFVTESLTLPPAAKPAPPEIISYDETVISPPQVEAETSAAETVAAPLPVEPETSAGETVFAPETETTAADIFTFEEDDSWGGAALPDLLHLESDDLESALFDTRFRQAADFDVPVSATNEYKAAEPLTMPEISDPRLAQIALQLTQLSLELTAEETLLTREGEIVACAGKLVREDLVELQGILTTFDDEDEDTRIAFVTLKNSGKDYVLYSRGTEDELVLSLLFSRDASVRDIRKQGSRLLEALRSVPEVVEEAGVNPIQQLNEAINIEVDVVEEVIMRSPFTYVWVTQNPNKPLSPTAAQAIMTGLNTQLTERRWEIRQILAESEYIYLLANVPGEAPPQETIRDLKRRASEIARSHDPALAGGALWADSYLVVTPGRTLEEEEIRNFLEFERMT